VVRGSKRIHVDRSRYRNYLTVAQNFFEGAEVAKEYEYWNAAGVLIVHAAIAYADAISIKVGRVKSRGEAHQDTVDLLDELAAASEEKKSALAHLRKIIEQKTSVSYSGEVYHRKDVEQLWKLLKRFQPWAENILKA
jgi:hypothetical protein